MPRKTLALVSAALVAACGGSSGSSSSGGVDPKVGEPNDSIRTATPLAFGAPVAASMASANDRDFYAITVRDGGATVRIRTSRSDGTACPMAGVVDTTVEVIPSTGTSLYFDDVPNQAVPITSPEPPPATDQCEDATVPLPGGPSYVVVSSWGGAEPYPWAYRLEVTLQ